MRKIFIAFISVLIFTFVTVGCVASDVGEISEKEPYTHFKAWKEFKGIWVQEDASNFVQFSGSGHYKRGMLYTELITKNRVLRFTDYPSKKTFIIRIHSPFYQTTEVTIRESRHTVRVNYSRADEGILIIANDLEMPEKYYYIAKGSSDIGPMEQIVGILEEKYNIVKKDPSED